MTLRRLRLHRLALVAAPMLAACGEESEPAHLLLSLAPVAHLGMPAAVAPFGAGGLVLDGTGVRTLDATGVGEVTDAAMRTWTIALPFASRDGASGALAADAEGRLLLLGRDSTEDATSRYALTGRKVAHLAVLGTGALAAATDDGLFVARTGQVWRYPTGRVEALGGGGDTVAYREGKRIVRLGLADGSAAETEIASAGEVAVGAMGSVLIAAGRELWRWSGQSVEKLAQLDAPVRDLRGYGGAVWFASGGRAGRVDEGGKLGLSADLSSPGTPAEIRLWVRLEGDGGWLFRPGELVRFFAGAGTLEDAWAAGVAPVWKRRCAECHDGSERNLSTAKSWIERRELIRKRVLVKKEMPPAEKPPLDAADLAAIEAWLNLM